MALVGYIDQFGITVPTYPEIFEQMKADYRSIFGSDVYLEPDSQEGQMLAMFSLALYDANLFAQSVYQAFSPQTAQGEGLSRMVIINGIARKVSTNSTVDVVLTGSPGTVVSGGIIADIADQQWRLPETVTFPLSGEITVTATAVDPGEVQAAAGQVNKIATPTRGWFTVTNPIAAEPGAPVETDAVLRGRQQISTALPARTIFEATKGAVASVTGVTRSKGYENDTDLVDAYGLPPHSIAMVVEGGDATAIGQAMFTYKAPGCFTFGTTAIIVYDKYGMPSTMRFFRPTDVQIDVVVNLQARPGYVSTTGDAVKANLVGYLNALGIGESVLLSKLYSPINAAEPDAGLRTFDVVSLLICEHGGTPAAANVPIDFNAVAVGVLANVTLTVS